MKKQKILELNKIRNEGEINKTTKMFIETLIKQIILSNEGIIKFKSGDFYDINKQISFSENSNEKILFGYSTGTIITSQGLYLRVSNKNKYISGQIAYEKIEEIKKNHPKENYKSLIKKYYKGKTVLTIYGNYKTIKIDDVSFDKILNTEILIKFGKNENKSINLVNYYKMKYSIDIKDKKLCLFIINLKKSNNVNYIILKLVNLTGMDDDIIENEGKNLKQIMIKYTKKTPNENYEKYNDFIKLLVNNILKKQKKIKILFFKHQNKFLILGD